LVFALTEILYKTHVRHLEIKMHNTTLEAKWNVTLLQEEDLKTLRL
jgi:hypothetical protein